MVNDTSNQSYQIHENTDSLERDRTSIQLDMTREIELPKYCKQTHRPCQQRISFINIFDKTYIK